MRNCIASFSENIKLAYSTEKMTIIGMNKKCLPSDFTLDQKAPNSDVLVHKKFIKNKND